MNKELDGAINADYAEVEKRATFMMGLSDIRSDLLDFHKITAALVFGVKYGEVTKDQRSSAKELNFRLVYSPGYIWQGPDEWVFRGIYTDDEWQQLHVDTRVSRPHQIYEAIKAHFNAGRSR